VTEAWLHYHSPHLPLQVASGRSRGPTGVAWRATMTRRMKEAASGVATTPTSTVVIHPRLRGGPWAPYRVRGELTGMRAAWRAPSSASRRWRYGRAGMWRMLEGGSSQAGVTGRRPLTCRLRAGVCGSSAWQATHYLANLALPGYTGKATFLYLTGGPATYLSTSGWKVGV